MSTRAQKLLRWATMPEQSGPKSAGEGAAVPLSMGKGAASPTSTLACVEAYLRTMWYPDPQQTSDKEWGGAAVLLSVWWEELRPHVTNVAWAEAYLCTKLHLDPSSRLATTDMGQKLGEGLCPFRRELGPHLTQCGLGRDLAPYRVAS